MKNKNKLSQLKVSSFVTSLSEEKEQTVQGGKPAVPTVVTRGYWSHCCGDFTAF
ncbi:MAG: pinensin family lanthipeptide [Cyclobacteriaceae bacterium]